MRMRLDQLLVHRGLFASREQAKRAIMAGGVEVDGRLVDKAGTSVAEGADLRLTREREPFASRAGRKLDAALNIFGELVPQLNPRDWVCADIGASTGGFTDCLLQRGAAKVYAIDVGYGQLDLRLREDPRVVVMERVNARYLEPTDLPERVRLVTFDVSFISLAKVVPALVPHLEPGGFLLPMIKPQFEAGRGQVGKGGIVRDEGLRHAVIGRTIDSLLQIGDLEILGVYDSPVTGVGGNREAFALFRHKAATTYVSTPVVEGADA